MDIQFKPNQITQYLIRIVTFLTCMHLLGQFSTFVLKRDHVMGLISLFDFEGEANFPAFYSSAAILFCSLLLALIATASRENGKPYHHWMGLAFIFLFLSADESIQIHERLIGLRKTLHLSGLLHHAWVLPYLVAAVLIALWYRKFILDLPSPFRRLFILAGITYVLGAAGFEMIGGWYRESHGWDAMLALLATTEELLEMTGIIIFARALMLYLQNPENSRTES